MNKFYVIGIGYRPLDEKASYIIKRSDVILATRRLAGVFMRYDEFNYVREKLKITASIYETMDYLRNNYEKEKISVLADGDPMFFGFGRQVLKEFNSDEVEILPDLSSMQVAFSRINEPWGDAFMMSLHGGPDPQNRRDPEFKIEEIPKLLQVYDRIGILTDDVNNPAVISKALLGIPAIKIYVCEKLGYSDEKIIKGTPEKIAAGTFSYPNVMLLIKRKD